MSMPYISSYKILVSTRYSVFISDFSNLGWVLECEVSLEKDGFVADSSKIEKIVKNNLKLLELIKKDLIKENADKKIKKEIYNCFSLITNKNEELRNFGITPTEIQTMNISLKNVIVSFENLSSISDYRTPRGLRAYSKIFLNIFPILFSPYFAKLNQELNLLGYVVALLFSTVLVILSNIQDNIENPFDFRGLDDINLDNENRFKNDI